VYGFSATFLLK